MERRIESIDIKIVRRIFLASFGISGLILVNTALLSGGESTTTSFVLRLLLINIGISMLVATVGFFQLKKWARQFTIVVAAVLLPITVSLLIMSLITIPDGYFFSQTLLRVIYLLVTFSLMFLIYYLTRPKIAEEFK